MAGWRWSWLPARVWAMGVRTRLRNGGIVSSSVLETRRNWTRRPKSCALGERPLKRYRPMSANQGTSSGCLLGHESALDTSTCSCATPAVRRPEVFSRFPTISAGSVRVDAHERGSVDAASIGGDDRTWIRPDHRHRLVVGQAADRESYSIERISAGTTRCRQEPGAGGGRERRDREYRVAGTD